MLHIWKARPADAHSAGTPGRLRADRRRLFVQCGQATALELLEVQIEGRKRMPAEAFVNGQRLAEEEALGGTSN